MKKLKRHSRQSVISIVEPEQVNSSRSAQAIYTSVIAPHYFLNNGMQSPNDVQSIIKSVFQNLLLYRSLICL